MKVTKHILFRFIFLITVLSCLGLEVYSEYYSPANSVELSEQINNTDNIFSIDIDAFDDDHMNQTHETFWVAERLTCLPIPKNRFPEHKFSYTNWQPPKNFLLRA